MRLVIMQPSYLPWLGYFDLFLKSDLFLVYDNVQFDKDGWRNRNRIKTPNGPQWLTVPVLTKGQDWPTNKEIKINNKEPWKRKHLNGLKMNYAKAPHFQEIYALFEPIYAQEWESLLDLNMACIRTMNDYLGITTPFQFSSDLNLDLPEEKNQKLIEICKHLKADQFYEPEGGKGYIDAECFKSQGIDLTFQNFQHPVYPQLHGPFVPFLSTVDLLFNCGKESIHYLKKADNFAGH